MNANTPPSQAKRASTHRSPAYPAIDLASAIDRARMFYKHEKRSGANVIVAVSHWGYGPLSSGGKQTLAALLSFGLMVDEGASDSRQVRLSDLAFRILLDERPDSPERDDAIRRAALMPKIHQEILSKWPRLEVSDANLRHYLLVERKFNENGARDLIKELRATISFANLDKVQDNFNEASGAPVSGYASAVATGNESLAVDDSVRAFSPIDVPPSSPQLRAEGQTMSNQQERGVDMQRLPVAPKPGTKQDTFSFAGSDGLAVFQWPAQMTVEEFEDLEAWIEIKLRSIKRSLQ